MNADIQYGDLDAARDRLTRLREVLFELHRRMLDQVRSRYESEEGRVTPQQFFRLLLDAPQFQWMRPLSSLLSETDEVLDDKPEELQPYLDVLRKIESLFRFSGPETDFTSAYKELLQASPEVASCHGDVRDLLPKDGAKWS